MTVCSIVQERSGDWYVECTTFEETHLISEEKAQEATDGASCPACGCDVSAFPHRDAPVPGSRNENGAN